jgi:hypothetical protein
MWREGRSSEKRDVYVGTVAGAREGLVGHMSAAWLHSGERPVGFAVHCKITTRSGDDGAVIDSVFLDDPVELRIRLDLAFEHNVVLD